MLRPLIFNIIASKSKMCSESRTYSLQPRAQAPSPVTRQRLLVPLTAGRACLRPALLPLDLLADSEAVGGGVPPHRTPGRCRSQPRGPHGECQERMGEEE